jgi:hypothetical protein
MTRPRQPDERFDIDEAPSETPSPSNPQQRPLEYGRFIDACFGSKAHIPTILARCPLYPQKRTLIGSVGTSDNPMERMPLDECMEARTVCETVSAWLRR